MATTTDAVHIKCGFCGEKFELPRAQVNALGPGKPICHSFQYVDQKVMIEAAVYPHGQDICQRCASRGLFFAGQSWFDHLHRPGEVFRGETAKCKRSFLYWLGWVLIVALLLFFMLLSGCHIQAEPDKANSAAALYEIDYSVLSDVNIPMKERQRLYQRFGKLKSLNNERKRQERG